MLKIYTSNIMFSVTFRTRIHKVTVVSRNEYIWHSQMMSITYQSTFTSIWLSKNDTVSAVTSLKPSRRAAISPTRLRRRTSETSSRENRRKSCSSRCDCRAAAKKQGQNSSLTVNRTYLQLIWTSFLVQQMCDTNAVKRRSRKRVPNSCVLKTKQKTVSCMKRNKFNL